MSPQGHPGSESSEQPDSQEAPCAIMFSGVCTAVGSSVWCWWAVCGHQCPVPCRTQGPTRPHLLSLLSLAKVPGRGQMSPADRLAAAQRLLALSWSWASFMMTGIHLLCSPGPNPKGCPVCHRGHLVPELVSIRPALGLASPTLGASLDLSALWVGNRRVTG